MSIALTADSAELAQVLGNGKVLQVTLRGGWDGVAAAMQRIADRQAAGQSPAMLADDARLLAEPIAAALIEAGRAQGLIT